MIDGADTVTFGDGNLDEAVDTPTGAPRVSHKPVGETTIFIDSVANDLDGVVSGNTAGRRIENTARVVSEGSLSSINGDGDRLLGDGLFHGVRGLRLDTCVS